MNKVNTLFIIYEDGHADTITLQSRKTFYRSSVRKRSIVRFASQPLKLATEQQTITTQCLYSPQLQGG